MWWSDIGKVGRLFVIIAVQVIACFLLGGWGLLIYPAIYAVMYIWIKISYR